MSSSDDKKFPVANKTHGSRFRRGVSANDFTLPKPYQKKPFVEDEPETSKARIVMLALSGIAAAGLVTVLAMVAKDHFDTRPVLVIAAPMEPPELADEAAPAKKTRSSMAAAKASSRASRPPLAALGPKDFAARRAAAKPALLAVSSKTSRPLRPLPKPEPAAHDPDVELITAILMLTPAPRGEALNAASSVCTAEAHRTVGCPVAAQGVEP